MRAQPQCSDRALAGCVVRSCAVRVPVLYYHMCGLLFVVPVLVCTICAVQRTATLCFLVWIHKRSRGFSLAKCGWSAQ